MATSGSVNFTLTRNDIINTAFQLLGVYGLGRTVSAEDIALANTMLNMMVKAWQGQGIHLWTNEEAYLFVSDNTASYTLSNDSNAAKACSRSSAVITTLSSAAVASATSLTVGTTTGMIVGDNIGVVLDSDVVHWTTVATIPTSTTLTISSGLATAAASGSNVYTFTSRINKPLKITSMRRVVGVDSGSTTTRYETPMIELSHEEYFDLPMKSLNGTPNQYYYNPDLLNGTLYLWPRPDDPSNYFELTYRRMLEDFDSSSDNADFPSEWLETLTYQLALRLASAFGKDEKVMGLLVPIAGRMLENMLDYDVEISGVQFKMEE